MANEKISIKVILACLILWGWGCAHTHNQASHPMTEWPALDEFHMIMAESYHPYMDSGNLVPARHLANEMALKAEAWSKGELPEKVNNAQVREHLKKLSEQTSALVTSMPSANDEEIGKQLTRIHDSFHHIQEMWYNE